MGEHAQVRKPGTETSRQCLVDVPEPQVGFGWGQRVGYRINEAGLSGHGVDSGREQARGAMASEPGTGERCSLLVVDDDPAVRGTLARLAASEFDVLTAESAEAARAVVAGQRIDLVLADQKLPGMSGVQLLEWVRFHSPKTVRLLMTGLAKFEDAVEAINCGEVYRYLFKPWHSEELLQVLRNASRNFLLERRHERLLEEMRQLNQDLEARVDQRTRELEEAYRQLQQQNQMLQRLALTDPLTNMPNRRAMDQLARSEVRRRGRYPSPLALGVVDVDHFKEVNSRYLLPGGDQVLIGLGKSLMGSLRTVDTVGRIGGEEFMVVAPETTIEGAATLGERIRAAVEGTTFTYEGAAIAITVSVGFGVVEANSAVEYEELKHAAAAALAEAKERGRNRCIVRAVPPRAAGSPASFPVESAEAGG
jgi:diguanylate cyclase (GGDEF)-like protein